MKTSVAKDVMNPDVLAVRVDMTARELAAFLAENQISGAPVVDREGRLVGVVSVTDIAESESEDAEIVGEASNADFYVRGWEESADPDDLRRLHVENGGRLVRDIMTPTVYTIPEDTPIPQVAKTMIAGRIHRLLVTRNGRVVGIVTSLDMLKLLCGGG